MGVGGGVKSNKRCLLTVFILSDKFGCLISYAESKARPPSAPNVVMWVVFAWAKKPYHPCDLVIWVFYLGKKAVSPT